MLTVLTTSLNYADYLAETLPLMQAIAGRVIVITAEQDKDTNAIAAQNCVEVFNTPAFFRDGAVFAKGSAINAALLHYKKSLANQWLLHMDADGIDLEYDAWHTPMDTIEQLSARSLQSVGDVLLAALPQIEARLTRR